MAEEILSFYDSLAEHYHLIFDDWDRAMERQGRVLARVLSSEGCGAGGRVLDCACGIGTQSLGLAALGYGVTGSDISPAAVERARREAVLRSLEVRFLVSDMTSPAEVAEEGFDAVIAMDNALPHLSSGELRQALMAIRAKLGADGLFLASLRDYDRFILEKPVVQGPAFYGAEGVRRIVHQVWEWIDDERYAVHLYITLQKGGDWQSHHFVSEYRCLLRAELSEALDAAGFREVRWLMPEDSGYYQPMVLARRCT